MFTFKRKKTQTNLKKINFELDEKILRIQEGTEDEEISVHP